MPHLSISAAAAVALLFVSVSAWAQVYKCSEGGKTVFSDRPCGEAASRLDVRPSTGGYDPAAAARIRSHTEAVNSRFDAEERARDRARQAAAARVEAGRQEKIDKCRKIREERDEAKYWASEFQHRDNIAREERKQKDAQDALWWQCREVW